ncbi:exodeoxyribonuclease VII small subunit [Candidatus Saccharibacteria bacterium]|nr:exodeoxyribonuclease VII small subunit [Candidatus Saccharibacteria bacterium]
MAKEVTITEKIKKLDEATSWFYSDEFKLDEATDRYQDAMKLAKEIEKDLNELKNKIEIIEQDFTKEA